MRSRTLGFGVNFVQQHQKNSRQTYTGNLENPILISRTRPHLPPQTGSLDHPDHLTRVDGRWSVNQSIQMDTDQSNHKNVSTVEQFVPDRQGDDRQC